ALDSTFATAWAQLSRVRSLLYFLTAPSAALGEQARVAAERARALRPRDPEVYLALGDYYTRVNPVGFHVALEAFQQALGLAPDNADLLSAAGARQIVTGGGEAGLVSLSRAAALDPRSISPARRLAIGRVFFRHYDAADSAADRGV